MPCCHPFKAFKSGRLTDNGKDDLIICSHFQSEMLSTDKVKKPIVLANAPHVFKDGHCYLTEPMDIPCGTCVGCRMTRAKEWKIRNCLELQAHPEAWFVTLTYDDAHLPATKDGEPCLSKRDFQLFLKRLRKNYGSLRYFGCGEYGEKTGRPHGHFILYMPLTDFRLIGVNKYTSDMIAKCWPYGHHLVECVTPGNIAYTCGYVEKKQKLMDAQRYPVKPFLMMSRRPGIGMLWFVKHYEEIKSTQKVYGLFSDGSRHLTAGLPKAFKRQLEEFAWFQEYQEITKQNAKKYEDLLKVVYGTPSKELLGFALDAAYNEKLGKLRKISL